MSSNFERLGSESIYDGKFISVTRDRFRYEDGEEATRELVRHPGAVGVVVLDDQDRLWFVRQPREAVGLPENPLRSASVLPEAGSERQALELLQACLLRGEVKDAPRSSESAQPGPGRRRRPLGPDPEVLEEDGSKLDQAEG